jgi:dihydrofolate reductase
MPGGHPRRVSTVVFDMSMSVDGYVTAANQSREEPLGEGGASLHDWIPDPTGQDVLASGLETLGAVICGRRTYDDSLPAWDADGPSGDALARAREAAGGKTVCVMGGPAVGNQYLRAGLVDELSIHLAPVYFNSRESRRSLSTRPPVWSCGQ